MIKQGTKTTQNKKISKLFNYKKKINNMNYNYNNLIYNWMR